MIKKQLSTEYFEKVPELSIIQNPYHYSQTPQQLQRRDVDSEFQLLRALTQTKKHRLRLRVNGVTEGKKNRYPQQSIYQHSRVILHSEQYVNANVIQGTNFNKMIITQAPLQTTLNDFNHMIIQNEITCVIMLCNFIQGNKIRCYDYTMDWINSETQTKGQIKITQTQIDSYRLQHIFYPSWPDKSVPNDITQLIPIVQSALQHSNILIHCSAGLGRSGVIAIILNILKGIENTKQEISVFGEVRKLREDRFGAVQNNQQYKFIYEFLSHFFTK